MRNEQGRDALTHGLVHEHTRVGILRAIVARGASAVAMGVLMTLLPIAVAAASETGSGRDRQANSFEQEASQT